MSTPNPAESITHFPPQYAFDAVTMAAQQAPATTPSVTESLPTFLGVVHLSTLRYARFRVFPTHHDSAAGYVVHDLGIAVVTSSPMIHRPSGVFKKRGPQNTSNKRWISAAHAAASWMPHSGR